MIDAFILQGCLSRHVELSRNMMDKNKAMHNEFKLHLKEYSNFLGPGSTQILPQYQDISLVRIYFNPVCHELILENSWPTTGSSKSRCFRQDVISLFFPTPDCLSFKLSVLFCFSKRFFYLRRLSISQNYTPGQKKIYTLCCLRFCLYLRIVKIRLIHMLYRHGSYEWIIMHEKCGRPDSNGFQLKWRFGTHGNWKNQNPGGRFGATS